MKNSIYNFLIITRTISLHNFYAYIRNHNRNHIFQRDFLDGQDGGGKILRGTKERREPVYSKFVLC